MLPSSKNYLIKSGYKPSAAAWILLGCFMGGFLGIQIVSRFIHRHLPSHSVDCDHSHKEASYGHAHEHSRSYSHISHDRGHGHSHMKAPVEGNGKATESTPLLYSENGTNKSSSIPSLMTEDGPPNTRRPTQVPDPRPSMIQVQKRVISFMKDTKPDCDSSGPCFGYSDPCGQECFKHIGTKVPHNSRNVATFLRTATGNLFHRQSLPIDEVPTQRFRESPSPSRTASTHSQDHLAIASPVSCHDEDLEAQHHHHVPENAFMSIGLQTTIAIALHKLPEGFITYATNHANSSLGFSVFMALLIHNVTEGFTMALPLYLALGSRGWAMFWASLFGGISQPLGAGIAAVWFKLAGDGGHRPGSAVYGCLFAVTAGIMASVALSLFAESLTLNHNRNLCIAFGFIGMAIMAMTNALTS